MCYNLTILIKREKNMSKEAFREQASNGGSRSQDPNYINVFAN